MQPVPSTDPTVLWHTQDETLTLSALWTILCRRRAIIVAVIVTCFAAASLYSICATRRYQATSEVQVEKEDSGAFGLETSVMGPDGSGTSTDSLDYNTTLQTQVNILKSSALALAVVHDLKLETTADYFPQKVNSWLPSLSSLLSWRKPLEPLTTPLEQAPDRRYAVEKIFASHLKVVAVTGTRLIQVSYLDPDPERAAAVVNCLVNLAPDFTFKRRFEATQRASSWLSTQMAGLKRQTQTLQAHAATLQRDTGMFGDDATRNVVLERLDSLNQALSAAEQNRILKEAVYKVAAGGDPELISSLSGNAALGAAGSPVSNSLTLIQNLRQQEANLRSQLAVDSERYGPAHPQVQELSAQLRTTERSIAEEVHRLGERARTDYEIAARSETSARTAFDKQKREASRLNDTVVAYSLAKQEADSSRQLYESLLAKLNQAGVLQDLRSSNMTVVSLAQVPPPSRPRSPNVLIVYVLALAGGSLIALMLVAVREITDNKIRSLEGLERTLGAPLLAVLPSASEPRIPLRKRLPGIGNRTAPARASLGANANLDGVTASFLEGLCSLRTALLLSRSGQPPQVILVTSCLEGEGKTTLAYYLAALFARRGSRVLLVDADLRKPSLHTLKGVKMSGVSEGLSFALSSERPADIAYPFEAFPTLGVVCGGTAAPFPAELLGSERMKELVQDWTKQFDFVILDSAPVLPVTDSVVLSTLSDATLLVARHGVTSRQSLRRGLDALRNQQAAQVPIGTVLNGVPHDSPDFYNYFGYRGGKYAYARANA